MANKKGALSTGWIIALIVVVLFVAVPDFQNAVMGIFKGGGAAPTNDIFAGKCLEHDAITMTLGPVMQKYAPDTSITYLWDRLIVNGVDKGLKQDGTTMTVTFGDKIDMYYAENSSTYYAAKQSFTVPCAASFDTAGLGDEAQLFSQVTPVLSVFNDDDSLKNTGTNNESMTADDTAQLELVMTFPGLGGFSPYGKVYINFRANDTSFEDVVLSGDGVEDASTSEYRSKSNTSTGYDLYTFAVPGREGKGALKESYTLELTTTSTLTATAAEPGNSTILVSLDDEDWYRHTKTGEMLFGPDNNEKADVGFGIPDAYTISIN